jgi:predicted RNA-binding protein Jag
MRDEIGRYIPEGIAVGIDKNAYKAVDSVKSMADELVQPIDLSGVRTSVNSTGYSNNMYSSSSNPLLTTMKAILNKLDNNSDTNGQLVINIDEFNNHTEEDINSLMQRIAAQIKLNNLGKGVR